ncbi:hypothetical protein [Priestia endophytica]|uniref:hypothetical protein n=1 Tax=Priestia endophytica TaxID=135735 RepID=UPI000DCA4B95|nr:hypothetical protein [Priestia endophytica]RAS82595.1 hypothetical protein A4R27_08845 [Priestia endophytica]
MKKLIGVILILFLVIGGLWIFAVFKDHQIAKDIEHKLEERMNREFKVTNIVSYNDGSGDYYGVTVEMEGIKDLFTLEQNEDAPTSLFRYDVISELWRRQYRQQINEIIKQHPLQFEDIDGTVGIQREKPVKIKNVPSIQEIREQYGKEDIIDNIDIRVKTAFPTNSSQQESENEKVYNLLQDLRNHEMDGNLSLTIEYKGSTQIYKILINDTQKDIYHNPEDMKKSWYKDQKAIEELNNKLKAKEEDKT